MKFQKPATFFHSITVLTVLAIGFVLSWGLAARTYALEMENLRQRFIHMSDDVADRLVHEIKRDIEILYAVKSFFEASHGIERQEYKTFASPLLKHYPTIDALEWLPRVPLAEKENFESRVRAEIADFSITDPDGRQVSKKMDDQKDFYPILFSEPPTLSNLKALGIDHSSDPYRKEAMRLSTKLKQAQMTPLISLSRFGLNEQKKQHTGFIAFLPVHKRVFSHDNEDHEISLIGFVSAVIRFEKIVSESIKPIQTTGLNIEVSALAENGRLWAQSFRKEDLKLSDWEKILFKYYHPGFSWKRSFNLAGESWSVECKSNLNFRQTAPVFNGARSFLFGILITAVLAAGLFYFESRRAAQTLLFFSLHDELTKLYNRRGFMMLAEQQKKLSQRNGQGLCLFIIDMDKFKQINDTYGHKEGDQALKRMAQILRSSFRGSDIIARLGGDEFAIIAIDSKKEGISLLSDKLMRNIAQENSSRPLPYALRVSIGGSFSPPEDSRPIEALLAEADKNMYAHKHSKN